VWLKWYSISFASPGFKSQSHSKKKKNVNEKDIDHGKRKGLEAGPMPRVLG
jgi:hypothetical protein